ncbi:DUF4091 domain-containing protein [Humidisolicoccus flavus]|uniref:DUF4091 domain-containing protein n=1 Tax=Humidisolicoccus flavus TaxID=3111414 RepID=UPI0032448C97
MHTTVQHTRTAWTFLVCDSLEKVLSDRTPRALDMSIPLLGYRGGRVSVQLAYQPPAAGSTSALHDLIVSTGQPEGVSSTLGAVDLVPCTLLAFDDHDDDYLVDTPGLYPDPIRPVPNGRFAPLLGSWRSVWVEFEIADTAPAGAHEVAITVHKASGSDADLTTMTDAAASEPLFTATIPFEIVDASLPALPIVNTHWFHCDGLATYYGVEVFSEEHWAIIDQFLGAAADLSINSILTPTWTPPLDTAIGGTRLPTQLIEITDPGNEQYTFDFSKLHRWLELCKQHGVRSIEIAHLFTQWGASATPAIWVQTAQGPEQRFGWDVPATAPSYRTLLEQLLPALRSELNEHWAEGSVLFHISDEPTEAQLPSYLAARNVVDDLLDGCTIADALSDYELFASGTVPLPIVATNAAQPFLDAEVSPLWLYYCVAQNRDVSNHFIAQPAARNRVIGTQLWSSGAAGFLHWGFNFYNTQFSTRTIDPFHDTSAGDGFLAGDSFLVYPGPGGRAWHSIRSKVFAEAMDDHRAMSLLASLSDEDSVRALVDPSGTLTLSSYPRDPNHYRRTWLSIGRAVQAAVTAA